MKRIYRKLIIAFLISIICIGVPVELFSIVSKPTVSNSSIAQDRLQKIKEKGVLTVASSNEMPFSYLDPKTNNFTGIEGDIITEIAKKLGIGKVEMKYVPFADLLTELNKDNDIDIVASGIYITPEREKLVSFTNPLYRDSEVVVVPKASRINSKEDLKNTIIGAQKGTVLLDLAETWKTQGFVKDVVAFDEQMDLLSAINNGNIAAGVVDSVVANDLLSKDKNLYLRALKDYTPELSGTVGSAVRKTDTTLLNSINEQINILKANKILYGIIKEHGLGTDNLISS